VTLTSRATAAAVRRGARAAAGREKLLGQPRPAMKAVDVAPAVALDLLRVRSHCRFRNKGTEYDSKYGTKRMSGGTE
jgi:hypothetical protein